ncbi:MAG: hypothetical protein ABIN01_01335 [Ferruginibacter sp.]
MIANTFIKCPIKYDNIIITVITRLEFNIQYDLMIFEIVDNSERINEESIILGGILEMSIKDIGKISKAKKITPGNTSPNMSNRKLSILEKASLIIDVFLKLPPR